MGKFEFYQDCKVKSWERDYFTEESIMTNALNEDNYERND